MNDDETSNLSCRALDVGVVHSAAGTLHAPTPPSSVPSPPARECRSSLGVLLTAIMPLLLAECHGQLDCGGDSSSAPRWFPQGECG